MVLSQYCLRVVKNKEKVWLADYLKPHDRIETVKFIKDQIGLAVSFKIVPGKIFGFATFTKLI